jgi:hypothetical protein
MKSALKNDLCATMLPKSGDVERPHYARPNSHNFGYKMGFTVTPIGPTARGETCGALTGLILS